MSKFNGKKFRELMDEKKLSERAVGEHIGYGGTLIHFFINGTRVPNIDQVVGMAELVGCSVDELIKEAK